VLYGATTGIANSSSSSGTGIPVSESSMSTSAANATFSTVSPASESSPSAPVFGTGADLYICRAFTFFSTLDDSLPLETLDFFPFFVSFPVPAD